jgi:hypothetical protein
MRLIHGYPSDPVCYFVSPHPSMVDQVIQKGVDDTTDEVAVEQ